MRSAPQFHEFTSKMVHFQIRSAPQVHQFWPMFTSKIASFQMRSAPQFHKFTPFFFGSGQFSNKECASISQIFVENGSFSNKKCAAISRIFVKNCQISKKEWGVPAVSGRVGSVGRRFAFSTSSWTTRSRFARAKMPPSNSKIRHPEHEKRNSKAEGWLRESKKWLRIGSISRSNSSAAGNWRSHSIILQFLPRQNSACTLRSDQPKGLLIRVKVYFEAFNAQRDDWISTARHD